MHCVMILKVNANFKRNLLPAILAVWCGAKEGHVGKQHTFWSSNMHTISAQQLVFFFIGCVLLVMPVLVCTCVCW